MKILENSLFRQIRTFLIVASVLYGLSAVLQFVSSFRIINLGRFEMIEGSLVIFLVFLSALYYPFLILLGILSAVFFINQIQYRQWGWLLALPLITVFVFIVDRPFHEAGSGFLPVIVNDFGYYLWIGLVAGYGLLIVPLRGKKLEFWKQWLPLLFLIAAIIYSQSPFSYAYLRNQKWQLEQGIQPEQRMQLDKDPTCSQSPHINAAGRLEYPKREVYSRLTYLGELFTAADCGETYLQNFPAVKDGMYILGSTVWLKFSNQPVRQQLEEVGFVCVDGSAPDNCLQWRISKSVPVEMILRLKGWGNLEKDDCVLCG